MLFVLHTVHSPPSVVLPRFSLLLLGLFDLLLVEQGLPVGDLSGLLLAAFEIGVVVRQGRVVDVIPVPHPHILSLLLLPLLALVLVLASAILLIGIRSLIVLVDPILEFGALEGSLSRCRAGRREGGPVRSAGHSGVGGGA